VSDPKTLLAMAEAQFALGMSTLRMLRDALDTPAAVSPPIGRQESRCEGINACALVNDEARQSRASFGAPHAWRCVGCGHQESTPRAM
jgi:hypothetical protein